MITSSSAFLRNGTICNRRPPEECRFEDPNQPTEIQPPATNIQAMFHVTVMMDVLASPKPKRYLKLEWTQAVSNKPGPVFVIVSPIVQGRISPDHVVCMYEDIEDYQTSESTPERKNPRDSTVVPWLENMTSSFVEIITNTSRSVYLVQTHKHSRHSSILHAVAITVQDNVAYISISPSLTNHQIRYTVTLVCYEYIHDDQDQIENRKSLNILSRSVKFTKCSDSQEELYFTYRRAIYNPIIVEMTHSAYKIMIDAQLQGPSQYQVLAESSLNTLLFGPAGTSGIMNTTVTQMMLPGHSEENNNDTIIAEKSSAPLLEEDNRTKVTATSGQEIVLFNGIPPDYQDLEANTSSIEVASSEKSLVPELEQDYTRVASNNDRETANFNGIPPDYQDSRINTSSAELASAAKSSAPSSETDLNATEDIIKIVLGVLSTVVVLILITGSLIAVKVWKNKINKGRQQDIRTSKQYDTLNKNDTSCREHLCVTSDCRPSMACGGKPKFRSDCCSHRTSDTPSNEEVSDPLIHSCFISSKSLNRIHNTANSFHFHNKNKDKEVYQESRYNDSKTDHISSNLLTNERDLQHVKHDVLSNGRNPSTKNYTQQRGLKLDITKTSDDTTGIEADIKIPIKTSRNQSSIHRSSGYYSCEEHRNCSGHNATKHWSNSDLNLSDQSILERELSEYRLRRIIEPEILAGDLEPWTMASECLKINQKYEAITGNVADMSHLQRCAILIDDECFSICDSIAC